MSDTKPGFVEKRLKLQRKYIEELADDAYEGCDGCEKIWKEAFIRGYYAAEAELFLNQNKDE